MRKILVVDDEIDVQELFKQKFRREIKKGECELHFAMSAKDALAFMKGLNPFDIMMLLSDINMPGMTGLDLLKQVKEEHPNLTVVMITAYGDDNTLNEAKKLGAKDLFSKPVNFEDLKSEIFGSFLNE